MMDAKAVESLKADFLKWSGGFEPESEFQITVYVDYARNVSLDPDEVRRALQSWIDDDSRR